MTLNEAFNYWKSTLPRCMGYPGCDNDLEGHEHADKCPMQGHEEATLWDAFFAGAAAERMYK